MFTMFSCISRLISFSFCSIDLYPTVENSNFRCFLFLFLYIRSLRLINLIISVVMYGRLSLAFNCFVGICFYIPSWIASLNIFQSVATEESFANWLILFPASLKSLRILPSLPSYIWEPCVVVVFFWLVLFQASLKDNCDLIFQVLH